MYFYKIDSKLAFSFLNIDNLNKGSLEDMNSHDKLYYLFRGNPLNTRDTYMVSHEDLLFVHKEDYNLLNLCENKDHDLPPAVIDKIKHKKVIGVNILFPNWKDKLNDVKKKKYKINVLGLGDVGSTLTIGLRLLGGDILDEIGIYSRNEFAKKRWFYELGQIYSTDKDKFPKVTMCDYDNLFDCDLFAFCASAFVPKVGEKVADVRMAQFEKNSNIIDIYAKEARKRNFKGIFAVVSDPVDLLCKRAYLSSNTNEDGDFDSLGLCPSQIQGYGLGVMHARAVFYSNFIDGAHHYSEKGRAFGPHGKGLIIANDINNYDNELSLTLTNKTIRANLDVRDVGFKPYIAPALSSGALSILATLRGDWNFSATFLGDIFMGAKNRRLNNVIEVERNKLDTILLNRIEETYNYLRSIL
ncbi:lactate/malate family dehydrogenase [Anaeromicrobium sediminis]|nr:lactate dehydrogenase [Anaeromicrobium sediminis]